MSNIESLASLVQQLTTSVKLWNDLRYICVGATAIFTVLSFLTFWVSGNKTDLLSKTKDELTKLKDDEQALKIAKVKTDSEEKIELVKADADKQIALLSTEATKAKENIEVAKAQAAQANETAEKERLARVKLEARLADRVLTAEQQGQLTSTLRAFAGTVASVVFFGDTAEIRTLAMMLLNCIRAAGWNISSGSALGSITVVKGILVGVRMPTDIKTANAAQTLISELQSMGIAAGPWDFEKMQNPGMSFGDLKGDTPMKIFIGSKP